MRGERGRRNIHIMLVFPSSGSSRQRNQVLVSRLRKNNSFSSSPHFRELSTTASISPKQAGKNFLVTDQSLEKMIGLLPCKGNGQ